jgi:intein/homing endonuclease
MINTKKIQIKDLAVGMKIKTLDENRNIVYKTVTDKWNTVVPEHDQIRIEFENGTVVNCSVNHPFMVWDSGLKQKNPLELTFDDRVLTETGFTRLLSCDRDQKNPINYIDITVEDTHTFFAANDEHSAMVLTHNSQGGIRNASCTVTLPIWHYQFDDFIVLKNNQGTEETRVRQLDYSVVISKLFWRRYKNGENITLFDPHEVPDLYEAYYSNAELFESLYVKYENDKTKTKKVLSAEEIFKNGILKERTDTGRIYLVNIDNVINQGPFDSSTDPIYQSNLCLTGDSLVQVLDIDDKIQEITLESFVEQFELGRFTESKIRSYDIQSNQVVWKTVSNAAKTATVTELIEIEDESGKIIRCTPNHKIFTKNRGYVRADELVETDELCVEI